MQSMLNTAGAELESRQERDASVTSHGNAALTIASPNAPNSFIFCTNDSTEWLRLAPDGFYVRGVKLEQDADEVRKVFEAFKDWLERAQTELLTGARP